MVWLAVVLASFGVAALLATADGALLALAPAASRGMFPDPERAHRALVSGRVLSHLVMGTALALAVFEIAPTDLIGVTVSLAVLLVHVALVEGTAKTRGATHPLSSTPWISRFVSIVDRIFLPVTAIGLSVERALKRALPPADEERAQREEGAEQFREVVAAEADVTGAEEEILYGVFSLGDTEVQEIMIPRVDVVGIEKSTPWSEVLDRVSSSEHARFPVFDDTLDNVLGILYAKDLLPSIIAAVEPHDDWSTLIRPATFIPATKTIDQQLRDFKAQRTHIALVIDEYGGTAGLVTIEDVLEEIVGEIRDEYDEEEASVRQDGPDRFWVAGRLSLADLSELIAADWQRDDLTTVAGLVYDAFGRVPRAGESKTINGFRVVVERVRRRRIERLYLERLAAAETA
ncbi:MAG TPA: hemolysin family protein [Gemmatimonadaceae bacterium]|nr:hemolysin family protein [Gemmatimonadaceae bacterium]